MDRKYSKYFNDVFQRTDDDVDYLALGKTAN
jgi:hypothetical protein